MSFNQTMLFGSIFEFVQVLLIMRSNDVSVNLQNPYMDEASKQSKSYKRVWVVFTLILGGARYLALKESNNLNVLKMVLLLHLVETLYFYREAWERYGENKLTLKDSPLLFVLWGIPITLQKRISELS